MAALARIVLRHASWLLVLLGVLDNQDIDMFITDPDLIFYTEMGLGFIMMAVTEFWYVLRRKFGEDN